ncbi:hypothetical protein ABIF78_007675 [Bradyrhizobium japonicum]
MSQFDAELSRSARDEGIARVLGNNAEFKQQFARVIDLLPRGWVGTCEDIRANWIGIQPTHCNAWGGCWNAAKRRGQLVELTEQVSMAAVKSHARKTHLHRKV